ncbi:fido domain-containing protein [Glomus cerebriforme]|uniref:Fido domain-containing protein n=1 Tax=Glomus cerebriforme TaxID=658196 RepID=A0A397SLM6_9GLOM|nr:fido domain-containing protein [Glomus cerebriforme]
MSRSGEVSNSRSEQETSRRKFNMIHSNFEILNKPWWKNSYDERDVVYFISSIKKLQHAILLTVSDNENDELFWKGYINLHREHYLLECISVESDVDLTIEFVRKSLKEPGFLSVFMDWLCRKFFAKSCIIPDRTSRLAKKIKNLHNAMNSIFPNMFFPKLSIDNFTPELAQQLHRLIGDELIKDAGQYRKKSVMAAQTDFIYMSPELIEDRMNELFCQAREKFKRTDLQLEEAIKFGSCFISYFLIIHPFINGNGRVARLLLSYLLSRFTVLPLSLYTESNTRDIYLQCLQEAQNDHLFKPSALAAFILESIYITAEKICVVMDIEV